MLGAVHDNGVASIGDAVETVDNICLASQIIGYDPVSLIALLDFEDSD